MSNDGFGAGQFGQDTGTPVINRSDERCGDDGFGRGQFGEQTPRPTTTTTKSDENFAAWWAEFKTRV